MKKRYLYSILYGAPGFFVALIVAFILFGVAAGFLWIFVYGDNPWPQSTEKILPTLFILVFLVLWAASITVGFKSGIKLEEKPYLNMNHIFVSIGATTLPIVLIILYQLSVGNIGKNSGSILCSDFCRGNGFSASGMLPKDSGESTCSCYGRDGQEAIKVPMYTIILDKKLK